MNESFYQFYDNGQLDQRAIGEALGKVEPIQRARGTINSFSGIDAGGMVSVRDGMTRDSYEYFRPAESMPKTPRDIILSCMAAYRRCGIIKNVIDMMSTFGSQGIRIVHPVKKRQKFLNAWFQKVKGPEKSERFLNYLYRCGNVFCKRGITKIKQSEIDEMQKAFGTYEPDTRYRPSIKPGYREIPIEYTFLNPGLIYMVGGDLATFIGKPYWILRIPSPIMTIIRTPKTPTEQQLIKSLPDFIRSAVQQGQKFIDLDNDKLIVAHYMRDDWMQLADPLIYAILPDIMLYEKMKLADLAALDGVISHVRVWRLGSLDHKMYPNAAAIAKLNAALLANPGGGSFDFVWGPDIDFIESDTKTHQFLGSAKYEPVLRAIYAGLGIPQSLTGGGKEGAGFTNNAISIKTLIERLQYGRTLLTRFWKEEIRLVQAAIRDDKEATIIYDNMNLYDEAAEKMLWLQMIDRDLVSEETFQEMFGLVPAVERARIQGESTQRGKGRKPAKSGPFHESQPSHQLTKIALQQGTISPTEAGVEPKPKKRGDKSLMDHQSTQFDKQMEVEKDRQAHEDKLKEKQMNIQTKRDDDIHQLNLKHKEAENKIKLKHKSKQLANPQTKGRPGQGRPLNQKDTVKRKQRTPKPRTQASDGE